MIRTQTMTRFVLALSLASHLNKLSKTCWFWVAVTLIASALFPQLELAAFRALGLVTVAIHAPMSPRRSLGVILAWVLWETQVFHSGSFVSCMKKFCETHSL